MARATPIGGNMKKVTIAAMLMLLAGITVAQADTFPSRQITLVVPFPPGGSTDITARIIAERTAVARTTDHR